MLLDRERDHDVSELPFGKIGSTGHAYADHLSCTLDVSGRFAAR